MKKLSDFVIEGSVLKRYNGENAEIVIPDGVETIGQLAFFDLHFIKTVTIPDTVTVIEDLAFARCSALESVSFPEKLSSIGEFAFDKCVSLESIDLPSTLVSIKRCAFCDCTSLLTVNGADALTYIGEGAFSGCLKLPSFFVPITVSEIGKDAFLECASLSEFSVDERNTAYTSIDGVLYNKDISELVSYPAEKSDPDFVIPDTVKKLSPFAFYGCKKLRSVSLPDALTEISKGAFRNCENLESIVVPDTLTAVKEEAFTNSRGLKTVFYKGSREDFRVIKRDDDNDEYLYGDFDYDTYAVEGKINIDDGNYPLIEAEWHYRDEE